VLCRRIPAERDLADPAQRQVDTSVRAQAFDIDGLTNSRAVAQGLKPQPPQPHGFYCSASHLTYY
jgi:hypothetical protein